MSEAATVNEPRTRPRRRNVVRRHPQASIAVGSSTAILPLIVWMIGLSGVDVPPEVSAAVAGVLASLVMLIGRRGIKPLLESIWNGSGPAGD